MVYLICTAIYKTFVWNDFKHTSILFFVPNISAFCPNLTVRAAHGKETADNNTKFSFFKPNIFCHSYSKPGAPGNTAIKVSEYFY